MIHLSLCSIIRIPCWAAASPGALPKPAVSALHSSICWRRFAISEKAKNKIILLLPSPLQQEQPFCLECGDDRQGAWGTMCWDPKPVGKVPASLGSPASSASFKTRSAQTLLSTLQTWAVMRTRCPHTIPFGFPAQTCHRQGLAGAVPAGGGGWRCGTAVGALSPAHAHRQLEKSCRSSWIMREKRQEPSLHIVGHAAMERAAPLLWEASRSC